MSLRLVFAGTPDFAVPVLAKLVASKHEIVAVYTQPDRPAGRGRKLTMSPVKQFALQHELTVIQPETLKTESEQHKLHELNVDVMIVVGFGMLLPKAILDTPRFGCINIHPSLLPKWRGAAPVQHTLLAGEKETGVTIMQLNEGMDSGDILCQEMSTIDPNENSGMLYDRLFAQGADLLLEVLQQLEQGQLQVTQQDHQQATLAPRLNKQQALIDWNLSAQHIVNQVRAFNPWPVAFSYFKGDKFRVWDAVVVAGNYQDKQPGEIVAIEKNSVDVATGDQCLRLIEVQLAGKPRQPITDLVNARRFVVGDQFTMEA